MSVVTVSCTQCGRTIERKKKNIKKSGIVLCSRECTSLYFRESQSDEYTMFRHMYGKAKSYAKRKYNPFTITLDDVKYIWEKQKGICNLSGVELKFGKTRYEKMHGYGTASLDRIDSSKGYIPGNIQIIHKDLQNIKSDLPQDYLVEWACLIAWHRAGLVNTGIEPPTLDRFLRPCYTTSTSDGDETPF